MVFLKKSQVISASVINHLALMGPENSEKKERKCISNSELTVLEYICRSLCKLA